MLFDEFGPFTGKTFQVLTEEGGVIDKNYLPDLAHDEILDAYKLMQYVRVADKKAFSYQRQGRLSLYAPNMGQEASAVGVGMVFEDEDWVVPAYREIGAWLQKGVAMRDVFLYWMGVEDACKYEKAEKVLPIAVPIASQIPHAAGIGYAMKYKRQPGAVFVFFGDGATSEGDFHEGMNFAGVWKAPVVFICQNNQYAISLPIGRQTASKSIAAKAVAYGMPGVRVDGNDLFAVYAAAEEAAEHARSGKGPVLIEAVTYRMGAHTTSDDPSRYRTVEEEREWKRKDPIRRLRGYLKNRNLWDDRDDAPLIEAYEREIDEIFEKVEQYPPYELEDVFKYHFEETPDIMKRQMSEYRRYLRWKEASE